MKKLLSLLTIAAVSTYTASQTISCDFIKRIKFNISVSYAQNWLTTNIDRNSDAYKNINRLISDYFKQEENNNNITESYLESSECKLEIKIFDGNKELKLGDKFENGQDITIKIKVNDGDKYFTESDWIEYHIGTISNAYL